jgi:hypothetical protein
VLEEERLQHVETHGLGQVTAHARVHAAPLFLVAARPCQCLRRRSGGVARLRSAASAIHEANVRRARTHHDRRRTVPGCARERRYLSACSQPVHQRH